MAISTTSLGIIKGIRRCDLEVNKSILLLRRVRDVPDDVVKLANKTLTALGRELNNLCRDVAKLVFKNLYG